MKYFASLPIFEERLKKEICWEDFIKVGGKVFKMYEYGGGSIMRMADDYVYFVNKKSHDAIYIKYICPSYSYKNGEKVNIIEYKFISLEFIPKMTLWRVDTL